MLVVFVLFLLSQRFGQISPLAFFSWFTATSDRNAESCNRIPSNYCLPCCLSHHIFDQVNLWPAWVGFETAIFWQCSPGTSETQRLYLLRHGPRRAIKDGFFGFINLYLFFQSRDRTEFLYLSLIGIAVNHLKKARGEIWPKRSERRNNTNTTNMRKKVRNK